MTAPVTVAGPGAGLLRRVQVRLAEAPGADGASAGTAAGTAAVASAVLAERGLSGHQDVLALVDEVRAGSTGAGPLDSLLADAKVTDVVVNGPDAVWCDKGSGLERTAVRFRDDATVRRLAQRLCAAGGRRLDTASPFCDVRLPGGVRLHAVLPPVSLSGTLLSLRIPRRRGLDLDALVRAGSLTESMADLLRETVRRRLAFLVSGGTGTGKTTLLAAMLELADPAERIVLVEDSAELLPSCPHLVRMESRNPNVEGAGLIDLQELVRQSLRMRPDRLVVGEVRGPEVCDLLNALNTGHEGGAGTVHANSAQAVPARIEALGATAGLPRAAIHSQLAAALDVVVHLVRARGGARLVAEVGVIETGPDGLATVSTAWRRRSGRYEPGPAAGVLAERLAQRAGDEW